MARIRSVRVAAVVNVNQSPEEVADIVGISPDDYVDHGNGYYITKVTVHEADPTTVASPKEDLVEEDEAEEDEADPEEE